MHAILSGGILLVFLMGFLLLFPFRYNNFQTTDTVVSTTMASVTPQIQVGDELVQPLKLPQAKPISGVWLCVGTYLNQYFNGSFEVEIRDNSGENVLLSTEVSLAKIKDNIPFLVSFGQSLPLEAGEYQVVIRAGEEASGKAFSFYYGQGTNANMSGEHFYLNGTKTEGTLYLTLSNQVRQFKESFLYIYGFITFGVLLMANVVLIVWNKSKNKLYVTGTLLAFAMIAVAAFVTLSAGTDGQKFQQIKYSQLYYENAMMMTADDEVEQPFHVDGEATIIRLRMATLGKQYGQGYLKLEIIDNEREEVLYESQIPLKEVKDHNNYTLVMKDPIQFEVDKTYSLRLSPGQDFPENAEVGVYCSQTTEENTACLKNGEEQEQSLTMAVALKVSAEFVYIQTAILLIISFAVIVVALWIYRNPEEKLHRKLLILCLLLGFAYWLVVVPFSSFDEKAHYDNVLYHVTNILESANRGENAPAAGTFYVKQEYDPRNLIEQTSGLYRYEENRNLLRFGADDHMVLYRMQNAKLLKPAYMYAPQILGGLIGYLLNVNQVTFFLLCGLANLLFYALVSAYAVKITPVGKRIFFLIALLPVAVKSAASFSYDAFINAFVFLFIALVLKIRFSQSIDRWDVVRLGVVLAVLAPCKVIYGLVGLLIFIIPRKYFTSTKRYLFFCFGMMAVAAVALMCVHLGNLTALVNTSQSTVSPFDGKASYSYMDVFKETYRVLALCIRTVLWEGGMIFLKAFGRIQYVEYPAIISMLLCVGIFMQSVYGQKDTLPEHLMLKRRDCAVFGITAVIVSLALFASAIAWTPKAQWFLQGVQGRYFVPILPLLFLLMGKTGIQVEEKTRNRWLVISIFANLIGLWTVYDKFIIHVLDSVRTW